MIGRIFGRSDTASRWLLPSLMATLLVLLGWFAPRPIRSVDSNVAASAIRRSSSVTGNTLVVVGDLVPMAGAPGGGAGNAGAVRDLTLQQNPAAIIHAGDLQYECPTLELFQQRYGGLYGDAEVDALIKPVIGNHEYCNGDDPNATGYKDYFGSQAYPSGASYYSFDVILPNPGPNPGEDHWHVVVLNSNCSEWSPAPGCGLTQAMENWFRADLDADNAKCDLVVFHEPAFATPAPHAGKAEMRTPWWTAEVRDVDLIVTGHNHAYERFKPQLHTGEVSYSTGIRSTIVGTGGRSLINFGTPVPNSSYRSDTHYGVLKLVLQGDSWTQAFKTTDGLSLDAVSAGCH